MLLYFSTVVTPKKVHVKRPASKSPVKKKKRGKMGPTEANPITLSIPVDEESQDKPRGPVHVKFDVKPTYQSGNQAFMDISKASTSQLMMTRTLFR